MHCARRAVQRFGQRGLAVQAVGNGSDFTKLITNARKDRLLVIDYSATWCRPCVEFGPIFDTMSEAFAQQADFFKVDIDQLPDQTAEARVTAVPTFHLVRNGKTVATVTGADQDELEKMINKHAAAEGSN
ncbi:Thioredoxin domain-containing protein [Plasmodiophora brassicae]|uniref:Thioredoxin domain-containing protein n=1 Tax=Plasmodiophora brassicae TaxID=37360 RepID=A0A0G4II33_PLABS|nr:hypothetical protein PBRA_003704 [Plasmodiophora brassicae]